MQWKTVKREYITYNQAQKLGGQVKKGSHGYPIIFFKILEAEDKANDGKERFPLIRYTTVFSLSDVEGLESKYKTFDNDPIESAENVVSGYTDVPVEHYDSKKAYYSPSQDRINVPDKICFPHIEEYYCTLFHEMVHSTGHKSRLNRFEAGAAVAAFGSPSYSFEELVAEIGAAMLCGVTGIEDTTLKNSASYIDGWLKVLKGDNKIVVQAASKAQKAADYIQGVKAPTSPIEAV